VPKLLEALRKNDPTTVIQVARKDGNAVFNKSDALEFLRFLNVAPIPFRLQRCIQEDLPRITISRTVTGAGKVQVISRDLAKLSSDNNSRSCWRSCFPRTDHAVGLRIEALLETPLKCGHRDGESHRSGALVLRLPGGRDADHVYHQGTEANGTIGLPSFAAAIRPGRAD
jgi:hypothetical protein